MTNRKEDIEKLLHTKPFHYRNPGKAGKLIRDLIPVYNSSKIKCPYCNNWNDLLRENISILCISSRKGLATLCKECGRIISIPMENDK